MSRTHERNLFLQDVLITAVEGGTGYWAACSGYFWDDDSPEDARVTLHPEDVQDENHLVTVETIAKGIALIRTNTVLLNSTLRKWIVEADRENDAGMIDADGADVIVQAALFGEIIYG